MASKKSIEKKKSREVRTLENTSVVDYDGLGAVTTGISVNMPSSAQGETPTSVTFSTSSYVHSIADGVSGYGVEAIRGYELGGSKIYDGKHNDGIIESESRVCVGTSEWTIQKTHDVQHVTAFVEMIGKNVDGTGAYGGQDSVEVEFDIQPKTTYRVTYNANADGATGVPQQDTKWHGESITLNKNKPNKQGYIFVGWATSSDGEKVYDAGSVYSDDSDVSLYAVWVKSTNIVSYDANHGIGTSDEQVKQYDVPLKLSDKTPSRNGYDFVGFTTDVGVTDPQYQPGDMYDRNEDATMHSIWRSSGNTITYNANGGYGAPESQHKTFGEVVNLSDGKPSKELNIFLGWAKTDNGEVEYAPGEPYSDNKDLTLYAVWKKTAYMKSLNGYAVFDEAARERMSGIRTAGDGNAYTVTVRGIESLSAGDTIVIVPHVNNTASQPTLNVNELGAKPMRRMLTSSLSGTVDCGAGYLVKDRPIRLVYNGILWLIDVPKVDVGDIYGNIKYGNLDGNIGVVAIQNEEPRDEHVKIWIKPTTAQ